MTNNKSLLLGVIIAMSAASAHACERAQRNVEFTGVPVTVYADKDSWVEVVFPEKIEGRLKETPKNLVDHFKPMSDRMYFQTNDPIYTGYVYANAGSGATYNIKVVARPGCPDSTVYIHKPEPVNDADAVEAASTSSKKGKLGLIEYLYLGKKPHGFREMKVPGNKQQRLVYKQGPVQFYLEKIWQGHRLSGFVLMAENQGRTPYRVAIEAIDYATPEIRRIFGKVRKITMNPTDMRLGPAPMYASDPMHPHNKGLIYIVSEKPNRVTYSGR